MSDNYFDVIKIFCPISFHFNFTLVDTSLFNVCKIINHLVHTYCEYVTKKISSCTPFLSSGDIIFVIASILLFTGLIPSRVTQKPKYFILVWPKKYFNVTFSTNLFWFSYCVSFNLYGWSWYLTFERLKGRKYMLIYIQTLGKKNSCKMCGVLLIPMGNNL